MKKYIRNIVILFAPYLLMIVINEIVRPSIKEKPYSIEGVTAINSADKIPDKCTWICHNYAEYDRDHHVKYLQPYFKYTDKFYFDIVNLLKATGNYAAANIVFLVVLIPLMIWFFYKII